MNKYILHYHLRGIKEKTPNEPDAPYCGCADWMDEVDTLPPPTRARDMGPVKVHLRLRGINKPDAFVRD